MRLRVALLTALLIVGAPFVVWRLLNFRGFQPEPVFVLYSTPVVKLERWAPAFADSVQAELLAGHYANLDAMAAEFRRPDALFIAGWPKLYVYYDALAEFARPPRPKGSCAGMTTEPGFDEARQRLEAWRAADPGSTAAQIALTNIGLEYAWDARGCDFADKVTPEQWALAHDRQNRIENSLLDLDPNSDPEVFYLLVTNAMLWSADREQFDDFYRRAVAKFPWYLPLYGQRAVVLLPKWFGAPGEERQYLDSLRRPDQGLNGQLAYTVAASELVSNTYPQDLFKSDGLDFRALIHAYEVRDQQYGLRDHDWNVIFCASLWAHDGATANTALLQMGDRWDPMVWSTRANFDADVKWFHQNSKY